MKTSPNYAQEKRRATRLLAVMFSAMVVLVSTHVGEFWPFSVYPMFSRAGNPWSRAIVRDMTGVPDSLVWDSASIQTLPGTAFVLNDYDIKGPDIANFVVKNRDWSLEGQRAFRKIFLDHLDDRRLMLFRLDGLIERDDVKVRATPVLLMSSDTTKVNSTLYLK